MELIVKLEAEVAAAVRSGSGSPQAQSLRDFARLHGLTLQPVHPGIASGELAKFFSGSLAQQPVTQALVEQLRALPGVETAYLKPSATPA
jgi:hypothetical protein